MPYIYSFSIRQTKLILMPMQVCTDRVVFEIVMQKNSEKSVI
jgi:hypothetical protein